MQAGAVSAVIVAACPRSFPKPFAETADYELDMMKALRDVKVDNNVVGSYQCQYLTSYCTKETILHQISYQESIPNRCERAASARSWKFDGSRERPVRAPENLFRPSLLLNTATLLCASGPPLAASSSSTTACARAWGSSRLRPCASPIPLWPRTRRARSAWNRALERGARALIMR